MSNVLGYQEMIKLLPEETLGKGVAYCRYLRPLEIEDEVDMTTEVVAHYHAFYSPMLGKEITVRLPVSYEAEMEYGTEVTEFIGLRMGIIADRGSFTSYFQADGVSFRSDGNVNSKSQRLQENKVEQKS